MDKIVKRGQTILFSVAAVIFCSFCLHQWLSRSQYYSRRVSCSYETNLIPPSGYYAAFSRGSELINAGKYEEALEEAKELKKELVNGKGSSGIGSSLIHSGAILYAYNLLRIASLSSQLKLDEEVQAWEELAQELQKTQDQSAYDEAYAFLAQNFATGEVSLAQYIKQKISQSN